MPLRASKEAVFIEDWINGVHGNLVGWIEATDETPPGKNMVAYKPVYTTYTDANKSWIKKFSSIIANFLFDAFGKTWGFEVYDRPIPKSAIDGFPNGRTKPDGVNKLPGVPDKRVILKNDCNQDRTYMDEVGPGSDSKKVSELQDKINDLEQQLEAERSKSHELEQESERDSSGSRSDRVRDYHPENIDGVEEGGEL